MYKQINYAKETIWLFENLLSVNFNDTQVCKGETSKKTTIAQLKTSRQINDIRDNRSRYGKYGPRSGYGFLRTACQPIRIENFEKPYNSDKIWILCSSGKNNISYE